MPFIDKTGPVSYRVTIGRPAPVFVYASSSISASIARIHLYAVTLHLNRISLSVAENIKRRLIVIIRWRFFLKKELELFFLYLTPRGTYCPIRVFWPLR